MRLLQFDTAAARDAYAAQGWVHVRDAVTPEFLAHAQEVIHAALEAPDIVGGNRANKDQFRFDFADLWEAQQELFDAFSTVASLDRDALVLSERHVNAYHQTADDNPIPHKDRHASQLSVGLSIDVAEGSHLALFPDDDRAINTYDSAAELYASLAPDRRPEVTLASAHPVLIYDRPGDMVAFAGSSTWHCRRYARGTINLFFKFNDFGADPLGEDARAATLSAAPASSG